MFEPFTRLPETEERSVPGTGLGLAIVKGFVELHGGSVTILEVPTGTCIRCRFPLDRGA
jgi:signal transduction histidine kinase